MRLRDRREVGETWDELIHEETMKALKYKGYQEMPFIPPITVETLVRIAYRGRGTEGDFLRAVLDNDLFEAFARADHKNEPALHNIVMWLYNEAPQDMLHNPNYSGIIARVDEPPKSESF